MKLLIAGSLLALTAMAAGLTMSVVFNATASTPAKETAAQVSAPTNSSVQSAVALDDPEDFNFDFDTMDFMMGAQPGMNMQMGAQSGTNMQMAMPMVPFGPGGNGPETQGIVSKLDGDKILINKDSRTINTNASTKFGDANGDLTKADIKVGDRIMAIGKVETDKSLTARWVLKLAAIPNVEGGKVTSVAAGSFKFTRARGNEEWTATVNAQTEITKDGAKITLDKLAKDDNVIITGKADSTAKTIEATRVVAGNQKRPNVNANILSGTVKSIASDSTSLVVTQKDKDGKETDTTVNVDANTKYVGGLTKLSDLKATDRVFVAGEKQTDGSVKATAVSKMPVRPGGPGMNPRDFNFEFNGGGGNGFPGGRGDPGNGGGRGGPGNGNNAPKASPTPNQ